MTNDKQIKDSVDFFKDVFDRILAGDVKPVEQNEFFESLEYPLPEEDLYENFIEVDTKMSDKLNGIVFNLSLAENFYGEGGPSYQYFVTKVEIIESTHNDFSPGDIFYFKMPIDYNSWFGIECSYMIKGCSQVYKAMVTKTEFVSKERLNNKNVTAI